MEECFTKVEVARLLKVSTRTVDRLRSEGKLKSLKINKVVRFSRADVDNFMRRSAKG